MLEKLEVFNDRDHGNEHFLLGIESAKKIIKNEPTAFDKAKVIEEILNVSHGYYNVETENEIVEIVKKGGIE